MIVRGSESDSKGEIEKVIVRERAIVRESE